MKLVIQRVKNASVTVEKKVVGEIEKGSVNLQFIPLDEERFK